MISTSSFSTVRPLTSKAQKGPSPKFRVEVNVVINSKVQYEPNVQPQKQKDRDGSRTFGRWNISGDPFVSLWEQTTHIVGSLMDRKSQKPQKLRRTVSIMGK